MAKKIANVDPLVVAPSTLRPDHFRFGGIAKSYFLGALRIVIETSRYDVENALWIAFDRSSKLNPFGDVSLAYKSLDFEQVGASRVLMDDPHDHDRRLWEIKLSSNSVKKYLGTNRLFFVKPSPIDGARNSNLLVTDKSMKVVIQAMTLKPF